MRKPAHAGRLGREMGTRVRLGTETAIDVVSALGAGVIAFVLASLLSAAARSHFLGLATGPLVALVLLAFAIAVARVAGILYALPVGVVSVLAFDWFYLPPLRILDGATIFVLSLFLLMSVGVGEVAASALRRATTIAAANAVARAELAESRSRIVAASDEARRRIERDLHDGTQQRLVALSLDLEAIKEKPLGGQALVAELSRFQRELTIALDELRELSRGIHPSILSEAGLRPALRALARRSHIPVTLDIDLDRRMPESVEVAAYYVAAESITNAIKHGDASAIEIQAKAHNGRLELVVRDDGVGGADPGRGSGIVGLRDRVAAIGGQMTIESPRGSGTTVRASLPSMTPPQERGAPRSIRRSFGSKPNFE